MNALEDVLYRYWGFNSFRPLQKEIIESVLNGRDTVALMPTGGGKSLCFQVPSLASDGTCIVISPLVALMQDQVRGLEEKGIKAINLSGGISFNDLQMLLDNALYGNYKFIYLSPERLQQDIVQNYIRMMNVNLIAIDEAHCISQWGNDFRPAYKNIVLLRKLQPLTPFLALTATATPKVLEDTIRELKLELPQIFKQSFVRSNLAYKVQTEPDKIYCTSQLLKDNPGAAIVYVRNRKATIDIAEQLNVYGLRADFYHGGLSAEEKRSKLEAWQRGKINTIVATSAFGMGIDHPHVRYVIHLQLPESLESYFQEVGRAGRDGEYAEGILLYDKFDDKQVAYQFIANLPTTSDLKFIYRKLSSYLQIAYGEGQNIQYQFNFSDFVKKHKLNSILTYNALKGMDRLGILELSEQFTKKTILKFVGSSSELLRYFERDMRISVIGKSILRLYAGISELPLSVDLEFISSKTGQSVDDILSILKRMHEDGVIELQHVATDASITYLVPREDDRTISKIAAEFERLNKIKVKQVQAMIEYVHNTTTCRTVQLVNYFGEKYKTPCGICSVCTAKNKNKVKVNQQVLAEEILSVLKEKAVTSKELVTFLPFPETAILNTLKLLLDNELIRLTDNNELYISK